MDCVTSVEKFPILERIQVDLPVIIIVSYQKEKNLLVNIIIIFYIRDLLVINIYVSIYRKGMRSVELNKLTYSFFIERGTTGK